MNTDQKQQLWDRFLTEWPVERIEAMTLAEYVSVEDKSTFTYWLETEAIDLGSIKGGSSEKFGIYKRADSNKRNGRNNYSHDDTYTWHSKHGEDASAAFANIKQNILDVIKAVRVNDLNAIEVIDVAPTLKWKVAFIYQNRFKPSVLNIYKASVLRRAVKNSKASMAQAYSQLLDNMPDDAPLFDYYTEVWASNQAASEQEIEQLIKSMNMDAVNNLSKTKLQQLYELTEWANDAGLDIYPVNIDNQFRIGRKALDSAKSDAAFKLVTVQKSKIKLGDSRYSLEYLATCEEDKDKFAEQYLAGREGYWPVDYAPNNSSTDTAKSNNGDSEMTMPSLNQILYGPPGTGKTYHTIEAAVKAAKPEFSWETRTALKAEYDELVKAKRIRFVTFHQSYGYEEFVEGITANTEAGVISYTITPGVFKTICAAAQLSSQTEDPGINPEGKVWKISIEGTYQNARKTYCFENNLAAIGWDDAGDLREQKRNSYFNELGRNDQNSLDYFSQEMEKGDLVLCINSNTSVEAVGVIDGDYKYIESGINGNGYAHQLPVKWLALDFSVDFHALNGNKRFNLPTCYPLSRLTVAGTLKHLSDNNVDIRSKSNGTAEVENYVLIIDEINRGNISKIFGELITLIEPSKRMPAERKPTDECLEISLPHSTPLFSVPDNLYLIGTMNTADRSLAMMDTALRRRFDFVEMMPKPELFGNKKVRGIDLTQLLETLNERIEILYDREHTLGHAFLFPAFNAKTEEEAFKELELAFKNKIIPLLEEYFFEDWDKIRLVLADNQKPEDLQFVTQKPMNQSSLKALFGDKHTLDQFGEDYQQYSLKETDNHVWTNADAYIGIYNPKSVKATKTSDVQTDSTGSESSEVNDKK